MTNVLTDQIQKHGVRQTQGRLLYANVSLQTDGNVSMSPKMSPDVCLSVTVLQNNDL